MRIFVRETVLGVALAVAGGTAHAQTVVAPAAVADPAVVAPVPGETVIRRETREVITRPVDTAGQASTEIATGRRTLHRSAVRPLPRERTARTATVRRDMTRRASAVRLSTGERQTIYRTIVEERIVPSRVETTGMATAPVAPVPRVVTVPAPVYANRPAYVTTGEYVGPSDAYVAPSYAAPPAYVPEPAYAAPPPAAVVEEPVEPVVVAPAVPTTTAVTYTVGSHLPATVPLYAIPPTAVARVPAVGPYRYAYVNGRVLLVDPATNIVVSDIY